MLALLGIIERSHLFVALHVDVGPRAAQQKLRHLHVSANGRHHERSLSGVCGSLVDFYVGRLQEELNNLRVFFVRGVIQRSPAVGARYVDVDFPVAE